MKTIATLIGGGMLVAALAITPSPAEAPGRAVVTMGPLEAPLPTPRVRVSNDYRDSVDVWYVRDGDARSAPRLGWVPGSATRTFLLPSDVGPIRIVVASRDGSDSFVTGAVTVDAQTDVEVVSARALGQSAIRVTALHVARQRRAAFDSVPTGQQLGSPIR